MNRKDWSDLTDRMNRKDWSDLTDEVIMDLENMSRPLHIVESELWHVWPRDCHPSPIGLLIAEVRRLREDLAEVEELRFRFYAWMLENHDDIVNEWEASE